MVFEARISVRREEDFSQQPPAQELIARGLHDVESKFKHIFRGRSVFVSARRLVAGDSVLFIWNEKNQLLLGICHATRPQMVMPSSVLSSDSMHINLLAAAAHAAATNSCFTVLCNPRESPSEFVIPLSKYVKAVFHAHVSVGMRISMLFEIEESSVQRYIAMIIGISDLDPFHWSNAQWRSVKVGWDESTADERQPRVLLWGIEPLYTFLMYPSLFPFRLKRPWHPGVSSLHGKDAAGELESCNLDAQNHTLPESCNLDAQNHTLPGVNVNPSGLLLPTTVPSLASFSVDADISLTPFGASGFQGSLYCCVQDPLELLQNPRQVDPPTPTQTFDKVYKSVYLRRRGKGNDVVERKKTCSSSSSSALLPMLFVGFICCFFVQPSGVSSSADSGKNSSVEAILSIQSPNGDIIDCIDIMKQPAFSHPLLKNYKLKLHPPKAPGWNGQKKVEKKGKSRNEVLQLWHLNGTRCPKGTVPIKRAIEEDALRTRLFSASRKNNYAAAANAINGREYANIYIDTPSLSHGARASISVWKPHVEQDTEMSISQIWILGGPPSYSGPDFESIEFGWLVSPELNGDYDTRFFIFYTVGPYPTDKEELCYNLKCGFVQTNTDILLGDRIPISVRDQLPIQELTMGVFQDPNGGDWWLTYGEQDIKLGFWPAHLFKQLSKGATRVEWGGEITNYRPLGAHTTTQMGSGSFPQEGYGKASYFKHVAFVDSHNFGYIPPGVVTCHRISKRYCYDLQANQSPEMGFHFYYGGPGSGPGCV